MDISTYVATDDFFGAPWIDRDEQRESPAPHRYLHGGFTGTATRFSLYFPPSEEYEGRFIQPLEGGLAGSEHNYDSVDGVIGKLIGGYDFAVGLGAYMVESNQGHVGAELCPKAGTDATVYGYRSSAEVARFARFVAAQLYPSPPTHGYVFGGSGGAGRSAMCLENVHDVWDGALTFMGVTLAPVDPRKGLGSPAPFAEMYNAQRVLGEALWDVVDAIEPGGSGDPVGTLSTHQRQVLQDLYRAGFPRGAEFMLAKPMGAISLWGWSAEARYAEDPSYYDHDFWETAGYLGRDEPERLVEHLISDRRVRVARVVSAAEMGGRAALLGNPELRLAVALEGVDSSNGFLQGCSLRIASGAAEGRQLWVTGVMNEGALLMVDGIGEAGNLRLAQVEPGDEVVLDNRQYLAYCYRYRHLVDVRDPAQAHLVLDGAPLYPQRDLAPPALPPLMGVPRFEGRFTGKVITVQHTHDSSIWPRNHSFEGAADRWVLRWTENAEHVPASALPPPSRGPSSRTRMTDWKGTIEQSLHDLVAWVERGDVPAGTCGTVLEPGGPLQLADKAAERGGIQPVLHASVDGAPRADVTVGQQVLLEVSAEVPPGAGTVIEVAWDLEGTGTFAHVVEGVDGTLTTVAASLPHRYDEPGTWFPSVRVTSHRDGELGATSRRVENLARVRVVVT